MAFAFAPDDGLPRLIRYVEHGTLPADDLICIYDKSKNLLIVDRKNFDALSKIEQHIVLRTQRSYIEVGGVLTITRSQFALAAE